MTRWIWVACLAAGVCGAANVQIGVFTLFRPAEITVRQADGLPVLLQVGTKSFVLEEARSAVRIRWSGGRLECTAGEDTISTWRVQVTARDGGPAAFILGVPGKIERLYRGTLMVTPSSGIVIPVITMDLETAVASVVAAEVESVAPREALKAQAVVSRSFYAAERRRHRDFEFCDTTHCQFLREPPSEGHPALKAAGETRGLMLDYLGQTLPALFSADCGGHTSSLIDSGLRADRYPYFGVVCRAHAAARRGHGIGLCQEGSRAMALEGARFPEILGHYYPNTTLIAFRP